MTSGQIEHPTKRVWRSKPLMPLRVEYTALMMIDLQYVDAHPDHGTLARARELGVLGEYLYYLERLQRVVIPNVCRLQGAFRQRRMELVHVHIASLTRDGRDRGLFYRLLGIEAPRNSKEAEFLPEVAPRDDEIVIAKTSSSPFNSTNIDTVLHNIGVRQIVLTGVMTSGCVESTARDASDRGYDVILVTDACSARTEAMEQKTHEALGGTIVHLKTTDELLLLLTGIAGEGE